MKLADLSPDVIERLRTWRWDRIIEKHEGPERWASVLEYYEPEFLTVEGMSVLLPVSTEHHPNITFLRIIPSADGDTLTLFLKDLTHSKYYGPDHEIFWAGFLAVCERFPGEEFYVAVVYHEWFIVENP